MKHYLKLLAKGVFYAVLVLAALKILFYLIDQLILY